MKDRRQIGLTDNAKHGRLINRLILGACSVAIILLCIAAANYVQGTAAQLKSTHQTFNDRRLRNGYVAISDVQRLVLILQKAVMQGQMTPAARAEFQSASDFLFVRIDNFKRVLDDATAPETTADAIAELERILVLADQALASDFSDFVVLSTELAAVSQDTRQIGRAHV